MHSIRFDSVSQFLRFPQFECNFFFIWNITHSLHLSHSHFSRPAIGRGRSNLVFGWTVIQNLGDKFRYILDEKKEIVEKSSSKSEGILNSREKRAFSLPCSPSRGAEETGAPAKTGTSHVRLLSSSDWKTTEKPYLLWGSGAGGSNIISCCDLIMRSCILTEMYHRS